MDGIRVCPKCRATIIDEELATHRHTQTYVVKGNILWVRWTDGKWYKHQLLSPEVKRSRKSPEDDNKTPIGGIIYGTKKNEAKV